MGVLYLKTDSGFDPVGGVANPTDKQVASAVENYLAANPVGGLSEEQIAAIYGLLKIAGYTKDATAAHAAFKKAFGLDSSEGGDEPDGPVEESTNLRAVYNPKEPSNLVVNIAYDTDSVETLRDWLTVTTGHDSGTPTEVTDYTLAENGANAVAVSYNDETTTVAIEKLAYRIEESDLLNGSTHNTYSSAVINSIPYTKSRTDRIFYPFFIRMKTGYNYTFDVETDGTAVNLGLEILNSRAADCVARCVDYSNSDMQDPGWLTLTNGSYSITPNALHEGYPPALLRIVFKRTDNAACELGIVKGITITATPVAS